MKCVPGAPGLPVQMAWHIYSFIISDYEIRHFMCVMYVASLCPDLYCMKDMQMIKIFYNHFLIVFSVS